MVAISKLCFYLCLLSFNIGLVASKFHRKPILTSANNKRKTLFKKWDFRIDPELTMKAPEIIRNRNYPVEVHTVTTKTGYILELHRIPPNRNYSGSSDGRQAKVVYYQPGFMASSGYGLVRGKGFTKTMDGSLLFLLADRGYDVWIGNNRGSPDARKHVTLDPEQRPFWDFSWDEMGSEDIPASINYILELTGEKQLSFICGSFGCSLFFIAIITQPELNNSIDVLLAWAPSVSLKNVKNPIAKFVERHWEEYEFYYKYVRRVRVVADIWNTPDLRPMTRLFCWSQAVKATLCDRISRHYRNLKALMIDRLPLLVTPHWPTGTSLKTMTQFVQIYRADDFLAFDYGREENLKRYGSVKPLRYDLSKVTVPVYLFWSESDDLVSKEDIDWTAEHLGNWKGTYKVDAPWAHMDFTRSPEAHEILNYRLLNHLPPPR